MSTLKETDERPVTCEERLKACEIQLMLNLKNTEQVRQHQLAYEETLKHIDALKIRIKTLENEIDALRQSGARNVNAMAEYLDLIENLDFKVESARLKYLVMVTDHFYLRFDRNGQIKKVYSVDEYNAVIKKEWESINAGSPL